MNKIFLIRHGQKNNKRGLSKEGAEYAEEFGKNNIENENVEVFVSSRQRVKDTAKHIIKDADLNDIELKEENSLSSSSILLDFDKSDFFQRVDRTASKPREEGNKKALAKVERENMKYWINFDRKRPDKGTASPYEVSMLVGKLILNQVKDLKNSNDNKTIINVTHEFMVAGFINYFVNGKSSDNIIKEIGYRVPPIEGVKIKIDEGESKVLVLGEEYKLDFSELF